MLSFIFRCGYTALPDKSEGERLYSALGSVLSLGLALPTCASFAGLTEASIHCHQPPRDDVHHPDSTHNIHIHAGQQWALVPHY